MVVETISGNIVTDIAAAKLPTFSRKLSDKGEWSVDVVLDDQVNRADDFRDYTDAGRYSWVIAYGDYICQAGPVWTHNFKDKDRTLTCSGSGIQGIFARRVVRNPTGHTAIVDLSEDTTFTNLTLGSILRGLVANNLTQTGYGLPIDLPASVAGTNTRTYFGYDLAMMWDRMNDLANVIDGPEFDFRPYFVTGANQVRWEMLIGNPLLGNQTVDSVWDYGGALTAIDVDSNGVAAATARAWVKGSGSERSLLTGFAEDTSLVAEGFPPTDYVDSDHSSVTEQATLEQYADADLAQFRAPIETWTCSVRIDTTDLHEHGIEVSPSLGNWDLGDAPLFGISGHPWIVDGDYRRRILGFSSQASDMVTLDIRPEPGT